MTGKLLILVTGATGMQGGSVVPFLFEDGGFRICAVTRKTDSLKGWVRVSCDLSLFIAERTYHCSPRSGLKWSRSGARRLGGDFRLTKALVDNGLKASSTPRTSETHISTHHPTICSEILTPINQ